MSRAPAHPSAFDLFALGRDGTLLHKAWDGAQWLPSPPGRNNLGARSWGIPPPSHRTGGDRMTLFAVDTAGALRTKW